MARLLLSAFADEYSADFDRQLAMLNENGIAYIEPRFIGKKNIADLTPSEVSDVRRKLSDAGIRVSSIGSPLGKLSLDDDFAAHLDKCARVFETAAALEAKNVRMFSFYPHKGSSIAASRKEVLEKLESMLELAGRYGVTLCHENEAEIYGESPESCLDLLDTFGGRMKCVFDMGNFVLGGYDPVAAYGLLRDHIEYFHIKDALYAGAIVPPGCGEARISEILATFLRDYDRDVLITLEPHLETFDGLNSLVGRTFENPYKFESKEAAFLTAVNNIKDLIK